jgi:hypothetical protein
MGARLLRFGAGETLYSIPQFQSDYSDNFGDAVPRTVRMPGMDGGYDNFGRRRTPVEIGSVRASWTLESDSDKTGMTALRDAVRKMHSWGALPLWMHSSDAANDDERFVVARISNVNIPEDRDGLSDFWQRVTVVWQARDPRWLSWPGMDYYGDGTNWDDGGTWAGPRVDSSVLDGSVLTIIYHGTAPTPTRWRFYDAAHDVTDLELRRLNFSGHTLDGFRWGGTLAALDALVVDGHDPPRVIYEDALSGHRSGYAEFQPLGGNGFIYLDPGVNTIEVSGEFSGLVDFECEYFDGWR